MAQFAVQGSWKSILALASLFSFLGLTVFAIAGGFPPPEHQSVSPYGLMLYGLSFLVIILGFWSKEDVIAVLGITGLSALVILDILLRIGVLSYNGIKVL